MTDLKERPELGWNLLLVLSVAIILVAAWFRFLQPKPPGTATAQAALARVQTSTQATDGQTAQAMHLVWARTWDVGLEKLGATVLDSVSQLAEHNNLQVLSFRTGKAGKIGTLQEAPVIVVVEGGFMDLMSLLNGLEDPKLKLAVNVLQVASNSGKDRVTATLALAAFISKEGK